jgi:type IV pilus assembly protein PilY1
MIYQAANDGMLHAFNGSNGSEAWAYVPGLVQNKLNALTSLTYSHQFYVDGTPVAGDVNIGGAWRTMLVGGLRAGGSGYYALDITSSSAANEAGVASKVMWEFPNAATGASTRDNIGLSFGKPVLVKTRAAGWVVLVTSGYNNPTGVGYLFVLDAATGTVLKAISTGVGTPSSPSGLAHIAAYAANPAVDATIDMVYGGDLHGNVWRFDLSTAATVDWAVSKLVQLTDSAGTGQPITSVPELALVANKRLVVVGTGQLLGQGDIASSQTQSIYGIVDDASGTTIATPRTALMQKTVVTAAGGIRNIASDSVDYSRYRGWYFDLPGSGERLNSDPSLIFGALIFSTNQPSPTACNGKSFFYAVDVSNGGQLPAIGFKQAETPWTGMQLATVLANQPVAAVLPSGTVEAFTHASDGSLVATRVPLAGSTRVRRMAWKEIVR